jgi:hypothetical protein
LAKLGSEGKNQLSPQCVHTWFNGTATLVPHENLKKNPNEGMMDVVSTWIKIMMVFHYHNSLGDHIVWLLMTIMLNSLWITKCPTPIKPPLCCCTQTILILLVNII